MLDSFAYFLCNMPDWLAALIFAAYVGVLCCFAMTPTFLLLAAVTSTTSLEFLWGYLAAFVLGAAYGLASLYITRHYRY